MVSSMYSIVRSNSRLASASDFPISHIMSRTTGSRCPFIRRAKSWTRSMRAATVMVGHAPRPRLYARAAACTASRAVASSCRG